MNKRGWMRILEATIAVLIVSGVLIVIYSQQSKDRIEVDDYFYNLQRQVLMDISSSSELRISALNGDEEILSDFAGEKIPLAFGYYLRVCDFGGPSDFCKIDDVNTVVLVQDKEVFVDEIIISAELGDGTDSIFAPKKVRLFVWEGRRD